MAYDEEKYHRTNRWLGQVTETVSAFKEWVGAGGGNGPEQERMTHHLELLKQVRDDRRLPDSFEQLIDEVLEMFVEVEKTLDELAELDSW